VPQPGLLALLIVNICLAGQLLLLDFAAEHLDQVPGMGHAIHPRHAIDTHSTLPSAPIVTSMISSAISPLTWDGQTQAFTPHAVNVLTLRGTQIEEIAAFLTRGVFPRLGLPGTIPS